MSRDMSWDQDKDEKDLFLTQYPYYRQTAYGVDSSQVLINSHPILLEGTNTSSSSQGDWTTVSRFGYYRPNVDQQQQQQQQQQQGADNDQQRLRNSKYYNNRVFSDSGHLKLSSGIPLSRSDFNNNTSSRTTETHYRPADRRGNNNMNNYQYDDNNNNYDRSMTSTRSTNYTVPTTESSSTTGFNQHLHGRDFIPTREDIAQNIFLNPNQQKFDDLQRMEIDDVVDQHRLLHQRERQERRERVASSLSKLIPDMSPLELEQEGNILLSLATPNVNNSNTVINNFGDKVTNDSNNVLDHDSLIPSLSEKPTPPQYQQQQKPMSGLYMPPNRSILASRYDGNTNEDNDIISRQEQQPGQTSEQQKRGGFFGTWANKLWGTSNNKTNPKATVDITPQFNQQNGGATTQANAAPAPGFFSFWSRSTDANATGNPVVMNNNNNNNNIKEKKPKEHTGAISGKGPSEQTLFSKPKTEVQDFGESHTQPAWWLYKDPAFPEGPDPFFHPNLVSHDIERKEVLAPELRPEAPLLKKRFLTRDEQAERQVSRQQPPQYIAQPPMANPRPTSDFAMEPTGSRPLKDTTSSHQNLNNERTSTKKNDAKLGLLSWAHNIDKRNGPATPQTTVASYLPSSKNNKDVLYRVDVSPSHPRYDDLLKTASENTPVPNPKPKSAKKYE